MARNISKESLEQKIEKIEKAISKNREQYDRLTAELEELHKKQKAVPNCRLPSETAICATFGGQCVT